MDKRLLLTNLFDYYGELLTLKQQNCFKDYYFNNLSLQEIGDNESISRNAIFNQLKGVEVKLLLFENKLKMYERDKKLANIISNIKDEKIRNELNNL
ncbi:MAG: hypothetical protein RR847_01335 [Bacilli bacterium]